MKQFADVGDQTAFEVALVGFVAQREEVEEVRVFQRLLGEVGLRRRQRRCEIGDGPALPAVKVRLDL